MRAFRAALFLKVVVEEDAHPLVGVFVVSRTITTFIIGVLEGVAGIGIFLGIHGFAEGLHGGGEVVDILRGDSLIEGAEVAEDGSMNLLERGGIGRQRTIINGDGTQIGIGNGELSCHSTTPAPADGSDSIAVDGLKAAEIIGRGYQVADAAILRDAAHELVGGLRISGDFATVEINRERDVALAGEKRCLLFDPVVQSPPFMNDNDCGMDSGRGRKVQQSVDGFVSAGKRDICGLSDGGNWHGESEAEKQDETLHAVHNRQVCCGMGNRLHIIEQVGSGGILDNPVVGGERIAEGGSGAWTERVSGGFPCGPVFITSKELNGELHLPKP